MLFTNALLFRPEGGFQPGSFRVRDGRFEDVSGERNPRPGIGEEATDLGGAKVIPGLMDIHTHGNSGVDFSDGNPEGLALMLRYYAANGITSVTPASMTLPEETLATAYRAARELHDRRPVGAARLMGINMEGPFFSYNKRGAQNPDYLRAPDYEMLRRLNEECGGLISFVDIAPELPGALEFIEKASRDCRVSLAHTETDYDTACRAFAAGAGHLTHLFNGMPGLHHREPGPIAAGAERENVGAELICDGLHVSPAMVRLAFRLFPGRVCIISDSLACCGLTDGNYVSGGLPVVLKDNICRLTDGTIAGAVCNAYQGMLNCISFGIPETEAILSATAHPARQAGCYDRVGSIEDGKLADFNVCAPTLERLNTYIGGERIS